MPRTGGQKPQREPQSASSWALNGPAVTERRWRGPDITTRRRSRYPCHGRRYVAMLHAHPHSGLRRTGRRVRRPAVPPAGPISARGFPNQPIWCRIPSDPNGRKGVLMRDIHDSGPETVRSGTSRRGVLLGAALGATSVVVGPTLAQAAPEGADTISGPAGPYRAVPAHHRPAGAPQVGPADLHFTPGRTLRRGRAGQVGLLSGQVDRMVSDAVKYLQTTPENPAHPMYAGATVVAAKDGVVVQLAAVGKAVRYTLEGTSVVELPAGEQIPAREDTIWDLASMSKLFTTTSVAQLIERGLVDLHAPVVDLPAGLRCQRQVRHHRAESAHPHQRPDPGPDPVAVGRHVPDPHGEGRRDPGHHAVRAAEHQVRLLRPEFAHARADRGEGHRPDPRRVRRTSTSPRRWA